MRQKREYRIFTFHTTAAAMEMEAFCREQGIRGRLVPVPRELSAGCGIAWRMEPAEYERFQGVIAESQIEIEYIGKSGGIGSSETFKKEWSADSVIPLLFGV